jgi:hypothetical protein
MQGRIEGKRAAPGLPAVISEEHNGFARENALGTVLFDRGYRGYGG